MKLHSSEKALLLIFAVAAAVVGVLTYLSTLT